MPVTTTFGAKLQTTQGLLYRNVYTAACLSCTALTQFWQFHNLEVMSLKVCINVLTACFLFFCYCYCVSLGNATTFIPVFLYLHFRSDTQSINLSDSHSFKLASLHPTNVRRDPVWWQMLLNYLWSRFGFVASRACSGLAPLCAVYFCGRRWWVNCSDQVADRRNVLRSPLFYNIL